MPMTEKDKTVILISSTSGLLGAHLFFIFKKRVDIYEILPVLWLGIAGFQCVVLLRVRKEAKW